MSEFTDQENFLIKYYDDAVKTQVEFGVPLQVSLAQSAIESEWGRNTQGIIFKEGSQANPSKKTKQRYKKIKEQENPELIESSYNYFKEHAVNLKRQFPLAFQYKHRPEDFIKSVQRDHEQRYSGEASYTQRVISVMALINLLIKELKLNNQYKTKGRRK
jgi:hypothetical protein